MRRAPPQRFRGVTRRTGPRVRPGMRPHPQGHSRRARDRRGRVRARGAAREEAPTRLAARPRESTARRERPSTWPRRDAQHGPRSPESCGGDPPRRFLCRSYILRGRAAPSPHPFASRGRVPWNPVLPPKTGGVQDKRALRACGATRLTGFGRVGQGHCAFERER